MTNKSRLPQQFILALALLFASSGASQALSPASTPASAPAIQEEVMVHEERIVSDPGPANQGDATVAAAASKESADGKLQKSAVNAAPQAAKASAPGQDKKSAQSAKPNAAPVKPAALAQSVPAGTQQPQAARGGAGKEGTGSGAALPQTALVAAPADGRKEEKAATAVAAGSKPAVAAPMLPVERVWVAPAEPVQTIAYEKRILKLEEVRQILATTKDFRRKNLANLVMQEFDFSDANLTEANLENADLYRADLTRANLSSANFKGASLELANFSRAKMKGVRLSRSSLFLANMQGADLESAQMRDCYAAGVKLQKANLRNADLKGSNLTGAVFEGSETSGALGAVTAAEQPQKPKGKLDAVADYLLTVLRIK